MRRNAAAERARGIAFLRCLDIANLIHRSLVIDDEIVRDLCTRTLLIEAAEQSRDAFEEFGGDLH